MKKNLTGIFILLISFISFASDVVTIITPEWNKQTNSDGSGIYFDILREIYKMDDISMKYTISNWNRAQHSVEEGKFDAMCGEYYKTDNNFITPKYPITYEVTVGVTKKGKFSAINHQAIEKSKLIWPEGYAYDKEFEFDVNYSEVIDTSIGIRNVVVGRADIHIDDLADVGYYLNTHPNIKSRVAIDKLFENYLYVIFSPTKRGQELASIFDKNMEKLIETGKIEEIYAKYDLEYKKLIPRE